MYIFLIINNAVVQLRGNVMAIDKSKSSCAFDIRPIAVNACALLRKAAKFFQPLFPAL